MGKSMITPCSGLGSIKPCERRADCANYRHWTDDPRSQFNICTITGKPFKNFVPKNIAAHVPVSNGQSCQQGILF
jgi:hypothetical protein